MRNNKIHNTKFKLPSKIKIISTLAVIASIIAITILIIVMIGVKTDKIIVQYNNLSSKPANSGIQFGKHTIYITRNNDGSLSISYGIPGSSATDGTVSGVDEIPDDLDSDGLPDDVDPDPLVPNECTCTTKCDASHQDSSCEYCAADWTKCKGAETDSNITIEPITGTTLTYPEPNVDTFDIVVINTKAGYKITRTENDFYSTEGSYNNLNLLGKIVPARVHALDSYITNAGSNEVLKANIEGETYYIGAMVDGFAHPGDIIQTNFKNGDSLKMIIVDVKSLDDAKGTGATNQFDSSYGHGTYRGSNSGDLNALEFITGGSNSIKALNACKSSIPGYGSYAVTSQIVGHMDLGR